MELTVYHELALSLGLGLLVGMQREWVSKDIAGIRTFPLITLLGTISAQLADEYGGWVLAGGLIAMSVMILVGNLAKLSGGRHDVGVTTEVATLVMFAVGAMLPAGYAGAAIAVTGSVAVLLAWKEPLHRFVERLGAAEFRALTRLVLVALVILPVLPNRTYGPYDVLNPFQIWLMVVLIVGISLFAYVAYKLLGARVGTLLGGVLGGLISSTATTVSYARRSRSSPGDVPLAALVIMIASTVVFGRVLLEIGLVAPGIFGVMAPPIAVFMGIMAILTAVLFARTGDSVEELSEQEPPSDLKVAIVFGLLYAAVIFAVAAAQERFGEQGMYVVGALSGLTDMDAITLSTAQLVKSDRLDAGIGWRIVLVAILANLILKGAMVAFLGDRRLLGRIAVLFALGFVAGAALLAFWP
jgi:uncharacterized membrane protein (DUF4010 family)